MMKSYKKCFSPLEWTRNIRLFLITIIVMAFPTNHSWASTQKSPEQGIAGLLMGAIHGYEESENRLPHSWDELRNLEKSNYYVSIIEKQMPEFIRKYRFLTSDQPVWIQGDSVNGKQLVIVMGNSNRAPGRLTPPSTNERSLIIWTGKGKFGFRNY
jgi:hypothetical protein